MVEPFAQQLVDWLTTRSIGDYRRYAFLLLALWVAYRLMRWVIARLTPWLLARVIGPTAAAGVAIGCILVLLAQLLATLPFRIARRRPPGLVFSAGDLAANGAVRVRFALSRWASRTAALRHVPRLLVLTVLATVGWWGHEIACRESANSGWCRRPAAMVNAVVDDVWEGTATFVRDAFSS